MSETVEDVVWHLGDADPDGVLLAKCKYELRLLMDDGLSCTEDLCFHTFNLDEQDYIMAPAIINDKEVMYVQKTVYEDTGIEAGGPLAGMKVQMQRFDNDDT